MQFNRLFTQTRREAPSGLDLPGQQWLARAGYIEVTGSALGGLPPLGQRALHRLEQRLSERLDGLGGVEIGYPDGAMGFTEVLGLIQAHLRSYRQLPAVLYRFAWHIAPLPRRGGGLIGARTSRVLEVFSVCPGNDIQEQYAAEIGAILLGTASELGLPLVGGLDLPGTHDSDGQSWLYPLEPGDESLLRCEQCGYSATPGAARFQRSQPAREAPGALQKVATPGCKTIAALAEFLGVPESRTAKAVFMTADESSLVFAVVRGDREVNEAALRRLLSTDRLRPATEDEVRAAGASPGYASPVGLRDVQVIVDVEIPDSPNLVAGANEAGFHLLNVNYGRDYHASKVAEIALARAGLPCPECGEALVECAGVQVAGSRRLDADYLGAQGVQYLDANGASHPAGVESHQLNLTRALGCLAEHARDDKGLILPPVVAPFDVHLVLLDVKKPAVIEAARDVEHRLRAAGLDVLVDDRPDSPGVKFNDADLLGLPVRITVSERALNQGGVEVKRRSSPDKQVVALDELPAQIL